MFKPQIKKSLVNPLECIHADTCLPDYWGGHHLAYISIPVYGPMTLADIKSALRRELVEGAIGGSDERTRDDSGEVGDAWFYRAHAAINKIKPSKKGQRIFFADIPVPSEDDDYSNFAYFVFRDAA